MITNILKIKKKEQMDKNMILVIYFLKVLNIISWRKKKDEEQINSQPEETIAKRVKLRRQKADAEDLSDMPPLESDERIKNINSKQTIN